MQTRTATWRSRHAASVLVALTVLGTACADDAQPVLEPDLSSARQEQSPTLKGRVGNATVGGLPGIGVYIAPADVLVRTDERGQFEATGLVPGDAELTLVGLPAACTDPGPVSVTVKPNGKTVVEIVVECAGTSSLLPNAGPDRDADRGEAVTLDGSASVARGNATFVWTQVSGPPVAEPLEGPTPTFTAPQDVSTLEFDLTIERDGELSAPDRVVVWIFEDKANVLFAAPWGSDDNPGTREAPLATLTAALGHSAAGGIGADVYVAGGVYPGSVALVSGASVYGGYAIDWIRDATAIETRIEGGATAISGHDVSDLTVDGLTIVADDATVAGQSSTGLLLFRGERIFVRNNVIVAGNGRPGAGGADGNAGANGGAGGLGGSGDEDGDDFGRGGLGGSGAFAGGSGGRGGLEGSNDGLRGNAGSGPSGGSGGPGGNGGNPGRNGGLAGGGGDGSMGVSGLPASGFTFGPDGYIALSGRSGTDGQGGSGGGGGGGGGGQGGTFVNDGAGAGGGGGGGGGRGGRAGLGGLGGGGSFGVVVVYGTGVSVAANEVITADGGAGGAGGVGGAGGAGGPGGSGGLGTDEVGSGGRGGFGGNGGRGGHGAGGNGGHSIGIVLFETADPSAEPNTITIGAAGAAGASAARPGAEGEAVAVKVVPVP